MENKEFKKMFSEIAKHNGFESAFGGWFKESNECIFVLDLMKSNFGNYYQLNIKIFVQGVFGRMHSKSKDKVKKEMGNIDRGEPKDFEEALDLENSLEPDKRRLELERLFNDFLVPFSEKSLTRKGIIDLAESGELFLLPAVKKELGIHPTWKCIEDFDGLFAFQEIDRWLHEKIRLHEAIEIMSYDSLINAEPQLSWVMHEGPPQPQDQKPKPKVRLIENLLTGELWELVEPSEYSKGRFVCLGKSPFSTPKDTDVNSDKSQ